MEMFKKFRNKVLLLNMAITSAVVLSAFSFIYFITYSNIRTEIEGKLDQTPGIQIVMQDGDMGAVFGGEINGVGVVAAESAVVSQDYLMFSMTVDLEGNIVDKASGISLEPEFFEQAAKTAWANPYSKKEITLGNKQWRYNVTPIISVNISETSGQISRTETDRISIVFLDVTAYNKTLFDLMMTLLLVGSVTLGVIFLVSVYFANRAIKPLSRAWEKQKQFVADASHELKTPLSIINANYDVLVASQDETVGSQMKWLDYMRIGTDRMAKLINDLLTLAKLEDTKPQEPIVTFDLSHTVKTVLSSMEAAMVEKNIALSVSITPNITVKSDPEGLKQVVAILLDNAIKYTDTHGEINVALAPFKRQVVLSVKNSGKGIPAEALPKIFDRFYRADPSRTHENGSYGLGLSIAKAVLDRVGAEIQAQSVEGESATFTVRLKL